MDLNKVIVLGTIPTADEERKQRKPRVPKSETEVEDRIDRCADCGCEHCLDEIDFLMDELSKMDLV